MPTWFGCASTSSLNLHVLSLDHDDLLPALYTLNSIRMPELLHLYWARQADAPFCRHWYNLFPDHHLLVFADDESFRPYETVVFLSRAR